MDTRRMTLIATIAVIALVFVGIGYAYTAYSANNGNHTETAYIVLTQTEFETPYTFADDVTVQLETYNEIDKDTTYYKINNPASLRGGTSHNYTAALLGQIKFHIALEGNVNPPDKVTISVAGSEGFAPEGYWVYLITDTIDANAAANANNITIYAYKGATDQNWVVVNNLESAYNATTGYADKTVSIYYGYSTTHEVEKMGIKFVDSLTPPTKLDGAKLLFKAESNTVTHKVTYMTTGDTPALIYEATTANVKYHVVANPELLNHETPSGKEFKGWSETNDVNATEFVSGEIDLTADKTLYAIYGDQTA